MISISHRRSITTLLAPLHACDQTIGEVFGLVGAARCHCCRAASSCLCSSVSVFPGHEAQLSGVVQLGSRPPWR